MIDATPEAVYSYLADLSRHGEWDAQTGFSVVNVSRGPVTQGSFCERERTEIRSAPDIRGAASNGPVSWVRSLKVVGCELNQGLDFETENIINGLVISSESVSFRLFQEETGTALVMTGGRRAHVPGPYYLVMLLTGLVQRVLAGLFVGWLFRTFPRLRTNAQLSRIKAAVERPEGLAQRPA
ncbi:MAG: hypothetical protein O3A93_14390 [Chloroflexi bacterium]|nr:hypothetical protein [Chloroflexota bacterium]MDA1272415.1 hypothetical protein [Chloroflexota bacterium]